MSDSRFFDYEHQMRGSGTVLGLVDDGAETRLLRWELHDAARGLLGTESRVCRCHRVAVPEYISGGIKVWRREDKHTYYRGLMVCANSWCCPVCAAKISERRRLELVEAVEKHLKSGGGLYHMLLTLPHTRIDKPAEVVDMLADSYRKLTYGAWSFAKTIKGYKGFVKTLEVTHGDAAGVHPHYHVLIYTDKPLETKEVKRVGKKLYERWKSIIAKRDRVTDVRGFSFESAVYGSYKSEDIEMTEEGYKHVCPVTGYITKFGADREMQDIIKQRRWNITHEMTKGNVRKRGRGDSMSLWEMLYRYAREGNKRTGALWLECVMALKGRSQIQWSRGLRAKLGLDEEKSDFELMDTVDAADVLVAKISSDDWKIIKRYNLRGDVLEILRDHDYDAVERLLSIFTKKEEKT